MIRINLLRDAAGGGAASGRSGVALDASSSAPGESVSGSGDILIKMLYLILPIALTVGYRNYQIGEKRATQVRLQAKADELTEKLKSYEPGLKDIEKFQEEKQKLDTQLGVIKQLSRERLKNVKSMDALQKIIPPKAWLTSLKISDTKVILEGQATDDLVISDFMKDLESSIYFKDVTLESSEESRSGEGTVKQYRIKCNLENL